MERKVKINKMARNYVIAGIIIFLPFFVYPFYPSTAESMLIAWSPLYAIFDPTTLLAYVFGVISFGLWFSITDFPSRSLSLVTYIVIVNLTFYRLYGDIASSTMSGFKEWIIITLILHILIVAGHIIPYLKLKK